MYILASASPRRKEILKLAFKEFQIIPSGIEETVPEDMPISCRPEHLARIKALDIAGKHREDIVIGADTSVIVENKILGKPKNSAEAKEMLKLLSNRTHKVVTGCAVCKDGVCKSFSVSSDVEFYPLSDFEIQEYIKTGEPFDKAGGYGIQSGGALFVKRVNGDYFNVVGLPVASLKRFIEDNFSL